MRLTLNFGGGLELLFDNRKQVEVDIPIGDQGKLTVSDVIFWARDNILTDRPDLFVKDKSVRPGILVLVNDVDWELRYLPSLIPPLDESKCQGMKLSFGVVATYKLNLRRTTLWCLYLLYMAAEVSLKVWTWSSAS